MKAALSLAVALVALVLDNAACASSENIQSSSDSFNGDEAAALVAGLSLENNTPASSLETKSVVRCTTPCRTRYLDNLVTELSDKAHNLKDDSVMASQSIDSSNSDDSSGAYEVEQEPAHITGYSFERGEKIAIRLDRDEEVNVYERSKVHLFCQELWDSLSHELDRLYNVIRNGLEKSTTLLKSHEHCFLMSATFFLGTHLALVVGSNLPIMWASVKFAGDCNLRLTIYSIILNEYVDSHIWNDAASFIPFKNPSSLFYILELSMIYSFFTQSDAFDLTKFDILSILILLFIVAFADFFRRATPNTATAVNLERAYHLLILRRYSTVFKMAPMREQPQTIRSCVICLQDIDVNALPVLSLPCSHEFHRTCLLMWVQQMAGNTCPYCRDVYFTDEHL